MINLEKCRHDLKCTQKNSFEKINAILFSFSMDIPTIKNNKAVGNAFDKDENLIFDALKKYLCRNN